MKTIEIQNCTSNRDKFFKVFVNGEKHLVRYICKIQIPEYQHFEIKAKYFWDGSSKYIFEPKDDMVLQVMVNQRMMNRYWSLFAVAMLLPLVITFFFGNEYYTISYIPWLILGILYTVVRRNKFFIIREF